MLGKFQGSHCDVTGIMVRIGATSQQGAQDFRLANCFFFTQSDEETTNNGARIARHGMRIL